MRLSIFWHWPVKGALVLALIYSVLFIVTNLNGHYVRLIKGGMVTRAISGIIFSSSLDFLVWFGILAFSLCIILLSFYYNKIVDRWLLVLLSVNISIIALSVCANLTFLLTIASLGIAILYSIYVKRYLSIPFFFTVKSMFFCFFILVIFVELASFVSFWLINTPVAANFDLQFLKDLNYWITLDLNLVNLTHSVLPWMYLFLVGLGVLSVFIKIGVLNRGFDFFKGKKGLKSCSYISYFKDFDEKVHPFFNSNLVLSVAFIISVVICIVLVILTVMPWINPTYRLVSVDAPLYYKWVQEMSVFDFGGAISWAFAGDRSIFMIFLYLLAMVIFPLDLVQFLPILLILAFSFFSLLLVKAYAGTREAVIYCVLLAPLSMQSLGVIYSGYFANMLAIIFVYLFYLVFLRFIRKMSRFDLLALITVSVLVLFTHPWTWFILASSLLVFLLIQLCSAYRAPELRSLFKLKLFSIVGVLLVSVLCDYVRQLLSTTSSVAFVYDTISGSLSFPSVTFLWAAMRVTVNSYLGGVFGCSVLVVLSIFGFLIVLFRKSDLSDLLISWVFIACVSILLTGSEFAYHKFIFSMPLVVFSSLGLLSIVNLLVPKHWSCKNQKIALLLIIGVVFLVLLNIALRFVTNITII